MTPFAFLQLVIATAMFITAGTIAKSWALAGGSLKFMGATLLYIAGNFIMMRLLRQVGMTAAFSLTNVLQLVAINLIAIVVFGQRVSVQEGLGIVLAIAAVLLITFAPRAVP